MLFNRIRCQLYWAFACLAARQCLLYLDEVLYYLLSYKSDESDDDDDVGNYPSQYSSVIVVAV